MHTLKHPSDTTATTTTETTPARALVAREDLARAILAALAPRDRRRAFRCTRDYLRALHGARLASALYADLARATDPGSARVAETGARLFAETLAAAVELSPLRVPVAALVAALVGMDPTGAAQRAGECDGASETAECRAALVALRRAYRSAV